MRLWQNIMVAYKNKNPKTSFSPTPSKKPKAIDYTDANRSQPSWRVSLLELVDPFGWHKITTSQLYEIREKLKNFESMTWNEILIDSKKQNHSINKSKLCREARKRLKEIELDDVDDVVSLRLKGEQRIWGIRQHNALLLLWWDPDHKICPSKKR